MTYRLPLRAAALLALALAPSLAPGQSPDSAAGNSVDDLVKVARGHEKAQRWEDAIQAWFRVLSADRANTEARDSIPADVRHALRATRYRDAAFLDRVLSLSQADVLALYSEVLTKIQAHYVDPEKVSVQRLFRQGLDEFLAALADPSFIARHLKGVDEAAVAKLRSDIQKAWSGRDATAVPEAVKVVAAIASAAKRVLGLRTINAVVCEFICGACNSLDEYSAYLSASQYMAERLGSPQLSVQVAYEGDNVAVMRITQFQPSTPQEVGTELKKMAMMGVKAVVLDLRGNGGGLFTAAIKTAEQFLPGGIIVTAQGPSDDANKVYTSTTGNGASDLPMIVLVDNETASAAEVLAVVLDLRGNGGGLFTAAIKTAEQFLPGGIIVTAQGPSEDANKVYTSTTGNGASDLPMIVLVDNETASAAEVLAVALRDNRRARLIGTATFGKGTVQKVISFTTAEEIDPESGKTRPRAAVRITLARLIAPGGQPITGIGVAPDQVIPNPAQQMAAALQQARELAGRYMGMGMMMPGGMRD